MGKFPIGLQLYTLRDATSEDFEGTLRKVAALGYEGVEFAGYGDIEAEKMRDLLEELGLKAIGSHVGLHLLEERIDEEIAYLKTIGAKYASIPWLNEDQRSAEAWATHFVKFEEYGKRFRDAGIQLLYHNHDFEFEVSIDGQFVFDALYERIGSDLLKVEMDIGWVQYAGQDPLEYIAKYAGKLPLLHLKDYRKTEQGIDTVELGRGELPLLPIIDKASVSGVEWIIVEQDNCANPPLEAVAESIQWLKDNYLNK
ncbi:sugar phosphate isomerase/epimerase family protein [Paenibacillus radicis (ex Gao et al. 2016)]|uniref:Sugar phosphate isomerase n=1 Tax=Paenibacillus radicis (ex Gao et al. 2016) TaxID=1737354 RepID=A0A917H0T5_9BACL|nr:sugar phosphate isomerase/epimerase [Paenibacillus radicis (ex Gao et al. 2016)]GGG63790.1 sugar phosphate isomerase [Paenibacillus radicis (ex Gao et al. 2016)]